jgi:L,D-peptidoglycan transpeptidase YkuD (ErfK/YbiS/YcfS/YnhG family)
MIKQLRKRVIIISLASFFLLFVVAGTFVVLTTGKPPVISVEKARIAYRKACKEGAEIFSPKLLQKSKYNYDQALLAWRIENEQFILKRDFHKVGKFAQESEKYANEAHDEAIKKSVGLKKKLEINIEKTNKIIDENQELFGHLPLEQIVVKNNARGRLFFSEAKIAFEQGKFTECETKLDKAYELISKSYNEAENNLNDYFENYNTWINWAQKTINESREDEKYAIIIDKFSRECIVYNAGKPVCRFDVELGPNWLGNKKYNGDKATPEGLYKIVSKKENPKTKYYKALLLDYPNGDDKKRFEWNKLRGLIKKNAQIGNLIEIHGDGGKGADWTDGCVALTNKDIDKIFTLASKGTPVTIVGSLKPRSEAIENLKD